MNFNILSLIVLIFNGLLADAKAASRPITTDGGETYLKSEKVWKEIAPGFKLIGYTSGRVFAQFMHDGKFMSFEVTPAQVCEILNLKGLKANNPYETNTAEGFLAGLKASGDVSKTVEPIINAPLLKKMINKNRIKAIKK